ncbi:MAG: hypothetical protein R3237_05005 [Nitrosopumilaceae archaeon]|nr:hypothetical protein [Nitrosopumilaceae archaeon]
MLIGIRRTLEILHKYVPRLDFSKKWERDNKENQGGSKYLMIGSGIRITIIGAGHN